MEQLPLLLGTWVLVMKRGRFDAHQCRGRGRGVFADKAAEYLPAMSDDAEKNEAPPEQEQQGKGEEQPEQMQEPEQKQEPEPEPEQEQEKPQEKPEESPKCQPPPESPPTPEVPASPMMVTVTIEKETVGGPQENGEPLGLRAGSAEELGSTPAPPTSPPTRSKSASLNDLKPQNSINGGPRAGRKSSLSGSQVQLAGAAGSPRASLSRQPSTTGSAAGEAGEKPRDYIFIAALSCFCPIWPINIVAFVYSIMSRISFQQGDIDGARRLARVAKLLSIVALVGGVLIIVATIGINYGDLLEQRRWAEHKEFSQLLQDGCSCVSRSWPSPKKPVWYGWLPDKIITQTFYQ
ncbi:proline-rich transmembrane protein 2 [Tiliqua scincoides]|uniref:proline-rich transmembrane protein 2 n=1 Tax=Tiliqua scincoides TaxID=71010 RepID=UPI003463401B